MGLILPEHYDPRLSVRETQEAIKYIRDTFQKEFGKEMNLERISAPLFVEKSSGLNDDLNGVERPVQFDIAGVPGETIEVVHSLAKWKRMALYKYGFQPGEGLYTNMNAIRRDEELDNLHSCYVDQWDWEKVIKKEERTVETLEATVRNIFKIIKHMEHEKEHFHFSLLFIAYGVKNPLSKEDRIDLFKHEYAHYMQYNMQIPEKYKWQAGTHGSAWKYCCSLIGAAPTPYYKAGEALMNHDYDKVLKNRIHDKSVPVRDTYQQLKTAQKKKDEVVQYKLGDAVTHPKFGHGIVEKINQRSGGVHLHIRFDGEVKCIDQKWLSRKKYM